MLYIGRVGYILGVSSRYILEDYYMIIRHSLPFNGFTKIDRSVFTHRQLSDGAKVLYGYICGLRNGADISDKYILKAMGISQRALTNRKKELKDADLILMDQLTPRMYVIYIGHSKLAAQDVKVQWKAEEDKYKETDT